MTQAKHASRELLRMLSLTQEQELDCEQFVELLGPSLEDAIDDAELRRLIEHHRDLCPECAEALAVLTRALHEGPADSSDPAGG